MVKIWNHPIETTTFKLKVDVSGNQEREPWSSILYCSRHQRTQVFSALSGVDSTPDMENVETGNRKKTQIARIMNIHNIRHNVESTHTIGVEKCAVFFSAAKHQISRFKAFQGGHRGEILAVKRVKLPLGRIPIMEHPSISFPNPQCMPYLPYTASTS